MNILLFAADDFMTFTARNYQCPQSFITLYIFMESMVPFNFALGYIVIEIVTRSHIPTILTYNYGKQ